MDGISSVFHVGGLISGLKTDDIVSKLVEIDSKPVKDAQAHQQQIADGQVAWKQLTAQLIGIKSSADRLAQPAAFNAAIASASDPDALALTTRSDALPGSMNVSVKALAMRHQILSQGFNDATSVQVGKGTIHLELGAAIFPDVVIDESNNTLQGVADAITGAASGIQASVVNDGKATGGFHLLLTSRATGEANQITVSGDLGQTFHFSTLQPAQDARVVIGADGGTPLTVTSSTNTIADAMPGLSMQLLKPADNVTINVARDTASIKSMINGFISSYNSTAGFFSQNMFYDAGTKKAGVLEGDTRAVALQDQLSRVVTGNAGSGAIHNLASMGITLLASGQLTISDSSAFENAVQNRGDDVRSFFADTADGLGKKVSAYVDAVQDPKSGLVGIQVDALARSYTTLGDYITERQAVVASKEAIYCQQFMDMETALSKLQSQSNAMASLLSSGSTSSTTAAAAASTNSTSTSA